MRLKKLEIVGFKSFRDKVVLDFSHNISSIVGPNGCGKSNITDSIRWVMGEQRVKLLRGKKMDDVIFGGTQEVPPVGMAEVIMTLMNDGRDFPGPYAEFSEVTISRKLFRDGESEYAINKVPCRLIDVREFFMDTGVGTRSYSFVEQNSIANLIEAGPSERRQFIEEAAGISKYKSRKDAAVRKMEATKQNLIRLQDITREVKSQLNALSRQAKRAEEYRDLKKEIKEGELALALQKFSELLEKKQELDNARQALKTEEIQIRTKLEEDEAALESLKIELLDDEKSNAENQERLYSIKNAISIKEQSIEFIKGKLDDMATRKHQNAAEMDVLHIRLTGILKEMEALKQAGADNEETISALVNAVAKSQKIVDHQKQADMALHRDMDMKKGEYIDIVTRKSNVKNLMLQLERQIEETKRREDKDVRELDDCEHKLASVLALLDGLKTQMDIDRETLGTLSEKKRALSADIEDMEDELRTLNDHILEIKETISKKSARLASLKEFHEGYQWCNDGTKSIMSMVSKAGGNGLNRSGFVGLTADFIDVPREFETAVEAVLGEKLQYIIVKSQEDGADAIDYLRVHSLGRGSFVPFDVRQTLTGRMDFEHLRETERLIEKVNVHDEYKSIVDYLLGDVLLIKDLKEGIVLWRRNGFLGTFVTRDGDIINPSGVLTGGSSGSSEKGLLRNKREITETQEAVEKLGQNLREQIQRKTDVSAGLSEREAELDDCISELHELEIQINSGKKDCERYEDEKNLIEQRMKIIAFNRDNLKYEQAELIEKIDKAAQELRAFEAQEKVVNDDVAAIQEQWASLRGVLEESERTLTADKVRLASLEEKRKANAAALEKLFADQIALSKEIEEKKLATGTFEENTVALSRQVAEDQAALEHLYRDYDEAEVVLGEKKNKYSEKQQRLNALDAENREVKKSLDDKLKEINSLELEQHDVNLQVDNLYTGIYNRYYVDLYVAVKEFEKLEQGLIDEIYTKLKRSRDYIENFGEVNLMALNEYEQIKERHAFLTEQLADVNTSLNSLQRTISKINKISRTRFLETFNAVNAYFQDVFARVFRGGKGYLRLTDETDLLETGVEIDIQIAGKRTQNISLLSGGEKSLAAIALIFAIILHRPSPFLVLDEVDAALDDANVSLFNDLIKDIAARSQILMVTHNKKTMEVADHLFGITMQKDGISSLVSVNLN
ncbi:MAG: chromosome segregation protein SMC [Deltaproteobacteria bacterium]|nr:chromosome segregation protein SMC [Deltaproteobacteria bacterium]